MDRKTYIKNIYSRYWIEAREKEYGFLEYDKNLCNYILKNLKKNSNILEVAIGTGFPFGDYFQNNGYKVYGVDIASILIEKCKKLNPDINCKIGDAENLEYPDNFFSCTYCFHSTSYFTDLIKSIDEMIRVTTPNGIIIFDIQNRNNKDIIQNYNKMVLYKSNGLLRRLIRFAKNITKIILRKGVADWTDVVHEIPTYPEIIYQYLKKSKIKNYKIMVKSSSNDNLEHKSKNDSFKDYSKKVFVLFK